MRNYLQRAGLSLALILASHQVFAAGGTITNGSGTITINGYIINNTCDLAISENTGNFVINSRALTGASTDEVLTSLPFTFTLTHCQGTPVQIAIQGKPYQGDANHNAFDGDDRAGIYYQIVTQPDATSGSWYRPNLAASDGEKKTAVATGESIVFQNGAAQSQGPIFESSSETATFDITVNIQRSAHALSSTPSVRALIGSTPEGETSPEDTETSAVTPALSATFTYSFTYF
ncbi:hypothetical protein DCF75_05710 [Edwardsiella tarda]|uniref:hypothetical protein n=1 Tax=Edwardsiella tarda TaxID=636 RepID=UPI000D513401|nr:hypothetical protein [Edwardsiella tarda]UCQ55339.1 hypothetical protein DCF75_05710 [Edwardsiella tarda]